MTYIIGIIVIGLFFLALHYLTDLDNTQKWWTVTIILAVLAIAIMFNEYTEQESIKMRTAVVKFNQSKTIQCDARDINNEFYSLSVGTYTFIGKENTPNAGEMISASDCE